jgi:hypothetical protein
LHLTDPQIVEQGVRKSLALGSGFSQPLKYRVRVDLKDPGHRANAQAFSQRGHHAYEQLRGHALAMKTGAVGLQEILVTHNALKLPPGAATGMAVGADIAAPYPAIIEARLLGAELGIGIHLVRAPTLGSKQWW